MPQILNMAFLAPDLVKPILNGCQPIGLTQEWLQRNPLIKGPSDQIPPAPEYIQSKIDAGGEEGNGMKRRHIAKYGYQNINFIRERAEFGRAVSMPAEIARIAEGFDECSTDSALFAAWKTECEQRAWPWFGEYAGKLIWLPIPRQLDAQDCEADFVKAAIEDFESVLTEIGNDKAGNDNDQTAR